MKHIKTFEISSFKFIYDTGDYVLLSENIIGMIIFTDKVDYYQPYLVRFSDANAAWFSQKELIRLATKEEIEKYKLKEAANKYNI